MGLSHSRRNSFKPRIEEDLGGCSGSDPCWPEMIPAGFAARGRSASGLARRPPTAKLVPPGGTLRSHGISIF